MDIFPSFNRTELEFFLRELSRELERAEREGREEDARQARVLMWRAIEEKEFRQQRMARR
jgi:hypothetical protein